MVIKTDIIKHLISLAYARQLPLKGKPSKTTCLWVESEDCFDLHLIGLDYKTVCLKSRYEKDDIFV